MSIKPGSGMALFLGALLILMGAVTCQRGGHYDPRLGAWLDFGHPTLVGGLMVLSGIGLVASSFTMRRK